MRMHDARAIVVFASLSAFTVGTAFLLASAGRKPTPHAREYVYTPRPPQGLYLPECVAEKSEVHLRVCWGRVLHRRAGCVSCHSATPGVNEPAPNWAGTYGTERHFEGGGSRPMDLAYIRRSILQPQADVVRGYTVTLMNPYRLSDRQIAAIATYIESLGPVPPTPPKEPVSARAGARRRR